MKPITVKTKAAYNNSNSNSNTSSNSNNYNSNYNSNISRSGFSSFFRTPITTNNKITIKYTTEIQKFVKEGYYFFCKECSYIKYNYSEEEKYERKKRDCVVTIVIY